MDKQVIQDQELEAADAIATRLDREKTDPNEVASCVGYLRDLARDKKDGSLFFDYLDTVIAEGRAVVRSGRTIGYYQEIRSACREYLQPYQDDPKVMAWILGWAARLMRYYAVEDKLGQVIRRPRRRPSRPKTTGDRRTGTVRWFDNGRGYGFIKPDGGGDDFFVHKTQTPDRQGLQDGQRVSFVVGKGPKGRPQAQNVHLE